MKAFGLPKATCQEFIQKMSVIGELDKGMFVVQSQNLLYHSR